MAARIGLHLTIEPLHHDHGHWCNQCLLGTGIRFWFVTRFPNGRMTIREQARCIECGGRDVTAVPVDEATGCEHDADTD